MAVRMVLVSLVASLGLSLPSSGDLNRWTKSTHDWLDTQLASWDAQTPHGTQAFVYFSESDFPEPTASVEPPITPEAQTIVTAPEDRAEEGYVAEEAFYDVEAPPTETTVVAETVETPKTETTVVAEAVETPKTETTVVAETVETPKTETTVVAETVETPKTETTTPKIDADGDFAVAMTDVLAGFAADRASIAVENEAVAQAAAPTEIVAPAVTSDRLAADVAALLEMEKQCLVNPDDASSHIEVADHRADDVVEQSGENSNRREASIEADGDESVSTEGARAEQIVHAFKLTRQAALAWANLLHTPSIVTIQNDSKIRE